MKIMPIYELVGIYFYNDYKRFKEGQLISLSKEYTVIKDDGQYTFNYSEENLNFSNIINKIFDNDRNINLKTIIGNNGAGKSTIIDLINLFYDNQEIVDEIFIANFNKIPDIKVVHIDLKFKLLHIEGFYDVIFIAKEINKHTKTLNINNKLIEKNNNFEKFIIGDNNHFEYLTQNIFTEILNLTKAKDDIDILVSLRPYIISGSIKNTHREKPFIIAVFLIISSILFNLRDKEDGSFNITHSESILMILKYIFSDNEKSFGLKKLDSEKFINNLTQSFFIFQKKGKLSKAKFQKFLGKVSFLYYYTILIYKGYLDDLVFYISKLDNGESKKELYQIFKDTYYLYTDVIEKTNESNKIINGAIFANIVEGKITDKIFNIKRNVSFRNTIIKDINKFIIEEIKHGEFKGYGNTDNPVLELNFNDLSEYLNLENNYTILKSPELKNNYLLSFDLEIKTNNGKIRYSDLSSGEKQMIGIFNIISNFLDDENISSYCNIILDEPENSLHIEWQRKFLYYFFDAISVFSKGSDISKFNIIISTHSPFLIADLPENNIIFLKRNKNTKTNHTEIMNFSELTDKINITINHTFLGNIPELIKGGFFLDGLYGYLGERYIEKLVENKDLKGIAELNNFAGDKFILEYLLLKTINKHD